jgi:hypothetical protein
MKVAQEQHLDEVTAQSYITSAKAVVSVGWDRSIILHVRPYDGGGPLGGYHDGVPLAAGRSRTHRVGWC